MADNTPVVFDQDSARRIISAVRRVEGTPRDGRSTFSGPGDGPNTFWAQLTAESSSKRGWYSWKLVYPSPTGWTDASPAITGAYNAMEASETGGLSGQIRRVELRYVGMDDAGTPIYVFSAGASKGAEIIFGRVSEEWIGDQGIAMTKVSGPLDTSTDGDPFRAAISFGTGLRSFPGAIGDIYAVVHAVVTGVDVYVLLGSAIFNAPTQDYQVLTSSNGKAAWDWLRVHS